MDKFFSFFGKFVLIALLIGAVAYGAFTLGKNGFGTTQESADAVSTPKPNTTTAPTQAVAQVSPTKKTYQTVTAGIAASAQLSFTKYQITLLDGWAYTNDTTPGESPTDTLTLTKGGYQIKIYQAATGGAMCLYPQDPAFEGPSSTYDEYVDITTTGNIKLRRSHATGSTSYTICAYSTDSWGQPTAFGHISYKTPTNPDLSILAEMDLMIASLKKI